MSENRTGPDPPRRGANTLPGVLQYVAGLEGGKFLIALDRMMLSAERYALLFKHIGKI